MNLQVIAIVADEEAEPELATISASGASGTGDILNAVQLDLTIPITEAREFHIGQVLDITIKKQ